MYVSVAQILSVMARNVVFDFSSIYLIKKNRQINGCQKFQLLGTIHTGFEKVCLDTLQYPYSKRETADYDDVITDTV